MEKILWQKNGEGYIFAGIKYSGNKDVLQSKYPPL